MIFDFQSQAMRVVRTIGQAFEVCQSMSAQQLAVEQEQEAVEGVRGDVTGSGGNLANKGKQKKLVLFNSH